LPPRLRHPINTIGAKFLTGAGAAREAVVGARKSSESWSGRTNRASSSSTTSPDKCKYTFRHHIEHLHPRCITKSPGSREFCDFVPLLLMNCGICRSSNHQRLSTLSDSMIQHPLILFRTAMPRELFPDHPTYVYLPPLCEAVPANLSIVRKMW